MGIINLHAMVELMHANVNPNYNFSHYMGDFLDQFYRLGKEERSSSIAEEPTMYSDLSSWYYAYIAAAVHQLCLKYGIDCPAWALDKKYVLKEPKFAMDAKGDLRLILIAESPYPFKARNLFVPDNVLSRV